MQVKCPRKFGGGQRLLTHFLFPHPADSEEQARPPRANTGEAVSQSPVEKMFRDEGEDRKTHGCGQHIEDPCHVIHIQLAGHHLILFIVADPSQPLGLQLLHFTYWRRGGKKKKKGNVKV